MRVRRSRKGLVKAGTPTNYGRFEPGPDYPKYQSIFDAMWATRQALDLFRDVDEQTLDDDRDAAEARFFKVWDSFEVFDFTFYDEAAGSLTDTHSFEPCGEYGDVSWRFGKDPPAYVYSNFNVYNSCLNILHLRGFKIWTTKDTDEDCFRCRTLWHAENDHGSFLAHTPVELLGLAAIYDFVSPGADPKDYWWSVDGPVDWLEYLPEPEGQDT